MICYNLLKIQISISFVTLLILIQVDGITQTQAQVDPKSVNDNMEIRKPR